MIQNLNFGGNQEIRKNWEIKKNENRKSCHIAINKMHILAIFHSEIMIFVEIRGHLEILPFHRTQSRNSESLHRNRAIIFEVEELDTQNFHRTCVI